MQNPTIFPNAQAVAEAAATRFIERVNAIVSSKGRCCVALSGGSTPKVLYNLLAGAGSIDQVPWSSLHLALADERFVPFDHPDNTLLLLRQTLLAPGQLGETNLHMPDCNADSLEAASHGYSATLEQLFDGAPAFDMILLGMGPDGHTASLFPGHPQAALDYPGWTAAVTDSPKPPPERITLTYNTINRAAEVWFLVTGADKAAAVADVFRGNSTLPAALARSQGETLWWVDAGAAEVSVVS